MSEFNKEKTNYCKGIGIILMIIHHLYWNVPNIGISINGVALSQRVGILGKVCVSIFLILSGYGIYKSNIKIKNMKKYFSHRIIKTYINYLFIVMISLFIGYTFFYSEITKMLGYGIKAIIRVIITMSGLQYIIGYQGFNPSWWFITLILFCYLIYPYVERIIRKYGFIVLIVYFFISFINILKIGNIQIFNIVFWSFPFVLGVYLAYSNFLEKSYKYIIQNSKRKILLILMLISLCIIRQSLKPQANFSIRIDWLLALIFIIFVNAFFENFRISKKIICNLGKLSMNMYYIHMFITTYYIGWLTYSFKYPIISIIFSIACSYICAYVIEKFKKGIGFYKFEYTLENYFNKLGEKK